MSLRSLVILAGVILALVAAKLFISTRSVNSSEVRPQIDGPGLARRGAPVAQNKNKGVAAATKAPEKPTKTEILGKTHSCENNGAPLEKISIPKAKAVRLIRGQPIVVFFVDEPGCIFKNSAYPAEMIIRDPAFKLTIWSYAFGSARAIDIRSTDIAHVTSEFPGLATRGDLKFLANTQKAFRNEGHPNKPLVGVVFKIDLIRYSANSFGAPLNHPAAQVVSANAEKSVVKGYHIIDVRPQSHFNAGAIPGAVNLPISNYGKANRSILQPSKMMALGAVIDLAKLPVNKGDPLLIYSNSPNDFASYNAASLIATAGYNKIHWLRGGYNEWTSKKSAAEIPNYIEKISYDAAIKRIKKSLVLDVRSKGEFNNMRIKSAISYPFIEKQDDRGLPLNFGPNFSSTELQAKGEHFATDPLIDRLKPIIIYGKNEYDLRAVKAAIVLFSKGYKQIAVVQGGVQEWRFYSDLIPDEFYLVGAEISRQRNKRNANN